MCIRDRYKVVQEMPILKICECEKNKNNCTTSKLLNYVSQRIRYTGNGIESKILATFIIEKDGDVSNIEIIKGKDLSNVKEVLKDMPEWLPGIQNNLTKRVKYHYPIRICVR